MQPIIFLENPKTGSTTLTRSLKVMFMYDALLRFEDPFLATGYWNIFPTKRRITKILSLSRAQQRKVQIVFADTGDYGIHEQLINEPKYISLVREPMSRMESEINYEYLMGVNVSEDYLAADYIRENIRFDNLQTRIFSGTTNLPYGECGEEHYQKAMENIRQHFLWVGCTEAYERSIVLLNGLLNRELIYFTSNVNTHKSLRLPDHDLNYLQQQNKWDRLLYTEIKQQTIEIFEKGSERNKDLERLSRRQSLARPLSGIMNFLVELSHSIFYPRGTITLKKAMKKKMSTQD